LCADIVALRKGDHSAERLKLARERLDFDRESDSRDLDKLLPKWAKEHGYEPRPELTPEEWADRMRQIFEVDERHDTRPQVKQPAEPSSPDQSNLIKPDQTNNSTAAT